MTRAFVAVVNAKTNEVPFWKIVPSDQADQLAGELREKFKRPNRDDDYRILSETLADDEGLGAVHKRHPLWNFGGPRL